MSGRKLNDYCILSTSCVVEYTNAILNIGKTQGSFTKTSIGVYLALALNNDDKDKVGELLRDFNPNSLIRKKPVISFVRSREMLDFLVARGLDLSLNRPLVHCKYEVFRDLVSRQFKVDIFSDYRDVGGWKKKELTKLLIKTRKNMLFILSGTILDNDMRAFVVDLVYPCPEPMCL